MQERIATASTSALLQPPCFQASLSSIRQSFRNWSRGPCSSCRPCGPRRVWVLQSSDTSTLHEHVHAVHILNLGVANRLVRIQAFAVKLDVNVLLICESKVFLARSYNLRD